jgi:V-type H+-transporting ATPase subunit A
MVTGGDILGTTFENELFDDHKILVPPRIKGKIKNIQI